MELHGIANGDRVVEIARTWIGTKYHHQAHKKGVGCDCIGLIIGVWQELFEGRVPKTFQLPIYTPHWGDETGEFNIMAEYSAQYLVPVQDAVLQAQPGDVCLWRMYSRGPVKHAGIISHDGNMIHAYYGHDVMETAMISNFGSKLTHLFRYPETWTE